MKLNTKKLVELVRSVVKESYGDWSADDPTEAEPGMQVMKKEQFVKKQAMNWINEFNAVDQGEMEIIQES